jgi:curved DNA-binding protein CbpA
LTQVREAYECLSDKVKRATYDALYFDLQDEWTSYREWQETQRKDEERKRADEEQRAARERIERERKAAEAERSRRKGDPESVSSRHFAAAAECEHETGGVDPALNNILGGNIRHMRTDKLR